ncbi:Las1-like-domain-containing protein [Zopfochytrium polystomum]|nr:Las1-like-domain-containing protein [Zopfochytrium polystomum]
MSRFRLPRIVPWITKDEWDTVYAWLYADPSQPELRLNGVKRVKAWSSRGKLPHAVNATAALVEVWLRDVSVEQQVSEHELRLMYCMAFIRFINGIVDGQQKGSFAQSVQGVAESLGMPVWFVDLRHAGTHDHLPSLQVLRSGCIQALDWLRANYWSLQKSYEEDTLSDLNALLQKYTVAAESIGFVNVSTTQTTVNMLTELNAYAADNCREFLIRSLLEPGRLVPIDIQSRPKLSNLCLPPETIQTWAPVLQWIANARPDFLDEFVAAMFEVLNESQEERILRKRTKSLVCTYCAWLHHILTTESFACLLKIHDALEACLSQPSEFSLPLAKDFAKIIPDMSSTLAPLIQYMSRSRALEKRLKQATKREDEFDSAFSASKLAPPASLPVPSVEEMANEREILRRRVEDLLRRTHQAQVHPASKSAEESEELISSSSMWSVSGLSNWHKVPLGLMPGLPHQPGNLDIPSDLDDDGVARFVGVFQVPTQQGLG